MVPPLLRASPAFDFSRPLIGQNLPEDTDGITEGMGHIMAVFAQAASQLNPAILEESTQRFGETQHLVSLFTARIPDTSRAGAEAV